MVSLFNNGVSRSLGLRVITEIQCCTCTQSQSGGTCDTPGFLCITTVVFVRQDSSDSSQFIQDKRLHFIDRVTRNVRSIIFHHRCYDRHFSEFSCQIQISLSTEKTSFRLHPFFQGFVHFTVIHLLQEVVHNTNRTEIISTVFRRTQFTLLDRFVRAFPGFMAMGIIRTHLIPDIKTVTLCITSIQTVPCIFLRCPETFCRYIGWRNHVQITSCKRGSYQAKHCPFLYI